MKNTLLVLLLTAGTSVFASQLVLDKNKFTEDQLEGGCYESIKLGKSVFASVLDTLYPQGQATLVGNSGGNKIREGSEVYFGPYKTNTYNVKTDNEYYPDGILEKISIKSFTKTGAVEIQIQQLNYLNSAELAEGRCDNAAYTLVK